jgi:hypothetical protein
MPRKASYVQIANNLSLTARRYNLVGVTRRSILAGSWYPEYSGSESCHGAGFVLRAGAGVRVQVLVGFVMGAGFCKNHDNLPRTAGSPLIIPSVLAFVIYFNPLREVCLNLLDE